MTSEERKEARYKRRVERRAAKKEKCCASFDDYEEVFSYKHLYDAYKKCRRNVSWKASVQKYITQAPLFVNQTHKQLMDGKFRSKGFYEFDLNERGKIRHIRSVTINERVVQRCLCDYALVPMLSRTLIYDNSASLKGKGYHFAVRRVCQHLREHYRKYGTEGYVLLFDFKKFFDSVPHVLCKKILKQEFTDQRIINLTSHFIDMFGDVGLGLGSQISQTFALASANRIDHYFKECCGIRGYTRYMDDGIAIHHSKKYLKMCLKRMKEICRELGLEINENKTQIVKITHGFTYLKARLTMTEKGRVIKRICKTSVTRARRKLKKLAVRFADGLMTYEDIYTAFQSWKAYARNFSSFNTVRNMEKLYNELFISSWHPVNQF